MAIKKVKSDTIAGFRQSEQDTGSITVQIALLTDRINSLAHHFKVNAKDFGSKRGLLKMVGRRRKFLNYLARHDEIQYKQLLERLGLRK
jgi:small subunit ribosomal protein S15